MKTENCTIRLEQKQDYKAVENLVREAFWNVYKPGCSEHYVLHKLRECENFVKELDFVMEKDNKIIGQIVFVKASIISNNGNIIEVLTMGPLCITPELKRQGYGKKLVNFCLKKATELGFGAVLIEGNIDFYKNCGFDFAKNFGIKYHDFPEEADTSFFLCRELKKGFLKNISGIYQTPSCYFVEDAEVDDFDKNFKPKQKLKLPGQLFFEE